MDGWCRCSRQSAVADREGGTGYLCLGPPAGMLAGDGCCLAPSDYIAVCVGESFWRLVDGGQSLLGIHPSPILYLSEPAVRPPRAAPAAQLRLREFGLWSPL